MALRDWHPWQIGAMWIVGIVLVIVILRRGATSLSGISASGGMSGVSVPLLPGVFAALVLIVLITATVWWLRRTS
jgi:hypothetical protein